MGDIVKEIFDEVMDKVMMWADNRFENKLMEKAVDLVGVVHFEWEKGEWPYVIATPTSANARRATTEHFPKLQTHPTCLLYTSPSPRD